MTTPNITTDHFFISVDGEDFIVKYEGSKYNVGYHYSGSIIQIIKYSDDQWNYHSSTQVCTPVDKEEKARKWMDFSYCWRGVWEGRVYFKDDEFWGEDIEVIHEVWKQIEAFFKDKIKTNNPDYGAFDD